MPKPLSGGLGDPRIAQRADPMGLPSERGPHWGGLLTQESNMTGGRAGIEAPVTYGSVTRSQRERVARDISSHPPRPYTNRNAEVASGIIGTGDKPELAVRPVRVDITEIPPSPHRTRRTRDERPVAQDGIRHRLNPAPSLRRPPRFKQASDIADDRRVVAVVRVPEQARIDR
jgi:hypothetical protein